MLVRRSVGSSPSATLHVGEARLGMRFGRFRGGRLSVLQNEQS